MNNPLGMVRSAAPSIFAFIMILFAVQFFVDDLFAAEWSSWAIAGATVAGAIGLFAALPRGGIGRSMVALGCLIASCFLISYDVMDLLADPVMTADWPLIIAAIVFTLCLTPLFAILVFDSGNSH